MTRHSFGSFVSLVVLALVCCTLGLKSDVVQAQSPKAQPPLPAKGAVSADLLRLLQANPQANSAASGISADMMQGDGQHVGVTITANDPRALVPALKQLGMQKITVAQNHHFLEGLIPVGALTRLDALRTSGLLGVDPMLRPWMHVGAVTSQADFTLEAERTRQTDPPGVDGTGVKIGVISDSFNFKGGAAADQASGDLPAVQVIQDDGQTDEGRGMLQLVHDIAPGSPLAFATANLGEANFANNIRQLADPAKGNCKIIVDDVIYFAEPMFQDGIVAQAADEVFTQRGVPYFSSAGNESDDAWETTNFHSSTDAGVAGNFLDYDPGSGVDTRQRISFPPFRRTIVTLQWDDPFYTASGVDTDLGILFVTPGTNNVTATIDNNNVTSQRPVEIYSFTNNTSSPIVADVMIRLTSGPAPKRVRWVAVGGSPTVEFATNSGTVYGHSAAKHVMSVGASPYFDQRNLESFSSFGPSTILFNTNGSALGAPEVRKKPNITAVDGCNTTFFGGSDTEGDGFPNFFGTSAAAPNAAAVAALVKQANNSFTPQDIYDALTETATDLGAAGIDNESGAGLVNAFDAIFSPLGPANVPFTDGFEDQALSRAWDTQSTGAGRIFVTNEDGPAVGAEHVALDSLFTHMAGLNELILNLNTLPHTNITLAYREKEFNDVDQAMPATFTGSSNTDGVAISVNGTQWVRVVSLTGADSTNTYRDVSFNLTQIATAAHLTLGTKLFVKFQQFGDQKLGSGGIVFDDIRVTAAASDGPDLVFLKFAPKPKVRGSNASIVGSVTVQNAGNKAARPCRLKFFLSADDVLDPAVDTVVKEVGVSKLTPRHSQKLKLKWKLPAGTNPSGQRVFAVVDSQKQIAETNEDNNTTKAGPLP